MDSAPVVQTASSSRSTPRCEGSRPSKLHVRARRYVICANPIRWGLLAGRRIWRLIEGRAGIRGGDDVERIRDQRWTDRIDGCRRDCRIPHTLGYEPYAGLVGELPKPHALRPQRSRHRLSAVLESKNCGPWHVSRWLRDRRNDDGRFDAHQLVWRRPLQRAVGMDPAERRGRLHQLSAL